MLMGEVEEQDAVKMEVGVVKGWRGVLEEYQTA
jgi:hypothetical protein